MNHLPHRGHRNSTSRNQATLPTAKHAHIATGDSENRIPRTHGFSSCQNAKTGSSKRRAANMQIRQRQIRRRNRPTNCAASIHVLVSSSPIAFAAYPESRIRPRRPRHKRKPRIETVGIRFAIVRTARNAGHMAARIGRPAFLWLRARKRAAGSDRLDSNRATTAVTPNRKSATRPMKDSKRNTAN